MPSCFSFDSGLEMLLHHEKNEKIAFQYEIICLCSIEEVVSGMAWGVNFISWLVANNYLYFI